MVFHRLDYDMKRALDVLVRVNTNARFHGASVNRGVNFESKGRFQILITSAPIGAERVYMAKLSNEKAWDYAIGLVQLDGIEPSKEFMELVEKEKKGEITGDDIRRVLNKKYKVKQG